MGETYVTSTRKALEYNWFPNKFTAVIWRNWETVPVECIAKALHTSVDNTMKVARLMGLSKQGKMDWAFLKRGYLTIIRNNWHLLNYDQICTLLDITKDELFFILKEDDFMWHKMGNMKPDTGIVVYQPLNEKEKQALQNIGRLMKDHRVEEYKENAFAFLEPYYTDEIALLEKGDGEGFEIVLPNSIGICYPKENDMIDLHVKDFCFLMEKRWGLMIQPQERDFNIHIDMKADASKKSGSYVMKITQKSIDILCVDEKGVYRALMELDKLMRANKGLYLNPSVIEKNTVFDIRYIYSYFALYGDALLDPSLDPYPEGLLRKLSESGVNGIWMQGILYQLSLYPFDPSLSKGYMQRRESLKKLVAKAKRFGIDIYMYFNEPRAMNDAFYQKYPELRGSQEGDFYALCTSDDRVKDYLYNGMKDLFAAIPDLAGFFTITMSENLTNCYSRLGGRQQACQRCKERNPEDVVVEVNNLMTRGAKAGSPDTKAIAWTWGWNPVWSEKAIRALDYEIMLMCVNEEGMELDIAGYHPTAIDYTMTVPGPSKRSIDNWAIAKETGRRTLSKVQLNCTWELAALPFLPLADICDQRIRNIKEQGVEGLMLSWTLGGCDSQNLDIASLYYDEPTDENALEQYMKRTYQDTAQTVMSAQKIFCDAMTEFPFHIGVLYTAPQNYAPAASFYEYATGYSASMIGFPHDNLKTWKAIYSETDFCNQFHKLIAKWKEGLDLLEGCTDYRNEKFNELLCVSKGAYYHYRSTWNHIRFVMERERLEDKKHIQSILKDETDIVLNMLKLRKEDSRIGFEASNHYFYTVQDLKEKLLNLDYLKHYYSN
ncbi:MAG TPA: hypothetical protein DDZ89_14455 [Clostridiales bacterium]|nr:hypothetical protein [Clostridiales bacterium]